MHLKRIITYDTGITRAVDAKEFARLVSTGGVAGAPQPAGVGVARPSAQPTAQPSQSAPSTTFGRGGRST
jgi:twitching motility protein PilT